MNLNTCTSQGQIHDFHMGGGEAVQHMIPGHAGLATNKLVDEYANEAAAEAMELHVSAISLSVIKNQIKKSML